MTTTLMNDDMADIMRSRPSLGRWRYRIGPVEFALKNAEVIDTIYAILRIEEQIRKHRTRVVSLCKGLRIDTPVIDDQLSLLRVTRRKPTDAEVDFKDWRVDFYERHYSGPCPDINPNISAASGATPERLHTAVSELKELIGVQREQGDWVVDWLRAYQQIDHDIDTFTGASISGTAGWLFDCRPDNRDFTL